MLCFPQMATKAQITAEQYLDMTFEYDAEFVHGELVERSMPDYPLELTPGVLFSDL
jgi:hypothetical protein